jgi:LPS export ABC transporter protein LptC
MLSKRATLYIILILIVIFLSIVLGSIQINQMKSDVKNTLLMQGEKIKVTQLDISGKEKYNIIADSFNDITSTKTVIKNPKAIFYNNSGQPPWHVISNIGYLYNQHDKPKETLTLQSNVKIFRKGSVLKNSKPLQITTEKLHIFVNNGIAYTPEPITILEPNSPNKTTAEGLIYSNTSKQIYLLADVNTHYQPTKKI